ncbi:unnamed protein product, partial [Mesorhabditis belari]|uniref:G-protein coupled receptors family 1 profile domain-containing protein n=1 Tax=Mesorhabditis belari TaxID=2138241 RepID=A0AAF3EPJ5_9BILA
MTTEENECDGLERIIDSQNSYMWNGQQGSYIVVIVYAIVCTFGAIANFVVLMAFCKNASLRTMRNRFIVNLAFSDLLLCMITAPAFLYLTANMFWPFGDLLCKTVAAVQAVNTFVSSLTLAVIALDRALLTICPVQWRLASTAPLIFFSLVWIVSALIAIPYGFAVSAVPPQFPPWNGQESRDKLVSCEIGMPRICQEDEATWNLMPVGRLSYTTIVFAIQYLLPLSALLYAYHQIGNTIRKRNRTTKPLDASRRNLLQTRKRRALLLLIVLVLTYAIAWFPMNLYNLLSGLEIITFNQYQYVFCHLIGISSTCVNPITYALVNENFRTALHQIFSWTPCCTTTIDNNTQFTTLQFKSGTFVMIKGHTLPEEHD